MPTEPTRARGLDDGRCRPTRRSAAADTDAAPIARRSPGRSDELLPALIAKLGATGLGELEVRQDGLARAPATPAEALARATGAARPVDGGRGPRALDARPRAGRAMPPA